MSETAHAEPAGNPDRAPAPAYSMIVRPEDRTGRYAVVTRWATVALLGVCGAGLLGSAAYVAANWRSEQALARLEGDVESRERLADARVRGEALRQAELAEAAARSVAESKLTGELARLDAARTAVADLRIARVRLDRGRESLLDGDAGRSVGADAVLASRAEAYLMAADELPGTAADAAADRLDGLAAPLRAAESGLPADYAPTPALARELDAVGREARERADLLTRTAGLLEDLAAEAGAGPADSPPLRTVLARRARERDDRAVRDRAGRLAEARTANERRDVQAEIDDANKVSAAERAADALVAGEKARKIRLAAEKAKADLEHANDLEEEKQRRAVLEREFARDKASVDRYLVRFHGRRQQVPGGEPAGRPGTGVTRRTPRGRRARRDGSGAEVDVAGVTPV